MAKLDKKEIKEIKNWLINVMALNEEQQIKLEKEFIKKEDNDMGGLAEVSREIYEDGIKEGIKEGKQEELYKRALLLRKILIKKIGKEPAKKIVLLMNKASSEKLDELEDWIFEITSWDEVEKILKQKI